MLAFVGGAFFLSCALGGIPDPRVPPHVFKAQASHQGLRQTLIDRLHDIDSKHEGMFNEEVTDLVSRFFPPGQTLERSAEVARREGLGELHPFKGDMEPGDGMMFMANSNLMLAAFSHVYIVVDLSFIKDDHGKTVVRNVRAFLRSDNM